MVRLRSSRLLRSPLAAGLLALSFSCAAQIFGMSPEAEKRIGESEHPKILAQFGGVYDDPLLAKYVDSIGQLLASASDAPDVGYTFTVLDSPVVNAFALPGGYVYVTRGLLALADSEAELAGVVAHEIGHVTARHGAKRQSKGTLATLGLAVLGIVTENPGLVNLGQVGALAVLSGFSRQEEHEADELGVKYLSRVGFEPGAMSSFLGTLERHSELEAAIYRQPPEAGVDFFATHPRTLDRVDRAVAAAASIEVADPIVARDIYLSKIDGLIFGDQPEQGFVRQRRFLHPVLGFQFKAPPHFRLLNGESSLVGLGPEGARLQFDMQRIKRGMPLANYLRRVWVPRGRLQGMEKFIVDRMDGITALAPGLGPGGHDVRLVAIRFRKHTVARFIFVLPPALGPELDAQYREAALSFKRIPKKHRDSLKPWRIAIHEVDPNETGQSLVAQRFPPGVLLPYRRFTVLNSGGRPRPGELVKLIVE